MFYVLLKLGCFPIPQMFLNIPNYKVFRCDNGCGAGACIYVRDDLKSSPIKLDITRPAGIEDVWLNVQCRKLPSILIGCLCRHPKALAISFDYTEEVLRLMSVRKNLYSFLVILMKICF